MAENHFHRSSIIMMLLLGSSAQAVYASEAPVPLAPAQLAECAQQAQKLRQESARLNEVAAENEVRRTELQRLRTGSRTSAEGLIGYNESAKAFNAHMVEFRAEVTAINQVKNSYDQRCAGRPYRRSELNALPPGQQEAMRRGMTDVRVPQLSSTGSSGPE